MISIPGILAAMQYPRFFESDPLNITGAPREVLTYQFATTFQPGDLPTSRDFVGWTPFTTAEKAAIRKALGHIESFVNIRFIEVTGSSDPTINIGKVDLPAGEVAFGGNRAFAFNDKIFSHDGYAVYDRGLDLTKPKVLGVILHELGHALGLKHPYSGTFTLPAAVENKKFTVMSETRNPDTKGGADGLQLFDVLALQDAWGAVRKKPGDTVYAGPKSETVDVIWDTGGRDTFRADKGDGRVKLDLRPGKFSAFGDRDDVVIAFGTVIENAVGRGMNDRLTGNGHDNRLAGRGGDDQIRGKAGDDKVLGGPGGDSVAGGRGDDRLFGKAGRDLLTGGSGGDRLAGGSGADTLRGGPGRDLLKGGGGPDTLDGQAGRDTLAGNSGPDTFLFRRGGDDDTIRGFRDDADTLRILGHGDKRDLLADARTVNGNTVFDFPNGDSLTVLNVIKADLVDDLAF